MCAGAVYLHNEELQQLELASRQLDRQGNRALAKALTPAMVRESTVTELHQLVQLLERREELQQCWQPPVLEALKREAAVIHQLELLGCSRAVELQLAAVELRVDHETLSGGPVLGSATGGSRHSAQLLEACNGVRSGMPLSVLLKVIAAAELLSHSC